MRPVVLKCDSEGKITITAEEIEKMLKDAYDNGYVDGTKSTPQYAPITVPTNPYITPTNPFAPTWIASDSCNL